MLFSKDKNKDFAVQRKVKKKLSTGLFIQKFPSLANKSPLGVVSKICIYN